MVLLSLQCAIVGQTEVSFDVEIDDSAKVSKLKDAIWEKTKAKFIHDDKFRSVVASDLQLFLAKKGSGWLPSVDLAAIEDGDAVLGFEKVSLVDTKRERYSTYSIRDVLDTNRMPPPQTRQIHLLVKVPAAATSDVLVAGSDQWKNDFRSEFKAAFEEQRKRARESVAMSSMCTEKRRKLLGVLKLPVKVVEFAEPQVKRRNKIPVFEWDPNLSEDKQVEGDNGYKKYLSDNFNHILTPRSLRFEHVEGKKNLLDTVDERLPFNLSGGADVLILKDLGDLTAENVEHLNGLRLVIELKKDLEHDFNKKEAQSIAELIAVNLRAPDKSAVVLLTNLGNRWIFMWLSEDSKIRKFTLKEPDNAAAFIEAIVSRKDLSVRIPFRGIPRLPMRGILDKMIPSEDGDVLEEMVSRYRAIASDLGPDMSMAREIGWQVVKQMPAYSSMYT